MHLRPRLVLTVLVGLATVLLLAPAATARPGSPVNPATPAGHNGVHPASYCSPSGASGASIAQALVLQRAAAWVARNVPYDQSVCGHLPGGYYREDCSGFVSMAWGLDHSLVTYDFNPNTNGGDSRFQRISRSSLIPGDALVVDNSSNDHIALFTGWGSNDHGAHRYANLSEESEPGVGTIAVTNQDLAGSYWGMFTPIHYTKLISIFSGGSAVYTGSSYHTFWTRPSDGHMMQSYYSSGWHTQDLGGVLSGAPGATYHSGRYDIFAVSPGGHLYHKYFTGSWSSWAAVAGTTGWRPGVSAVWTGASYHVFGHNAANHLMQAYYSTAWHVQDLGGITVGTPGSTYHDGRYDVFSVAPSNHYLYQRTYSSGSWGSWHALSGEGLYGSLGVAALWTGTAYHLFGLSSGAHLYHVYYSGGWHGPSALGGTFTGSVGVTEHSGRYDLFGPAGGGLYQSTYTSASGWGSWHKVA